MVKEKNTNRVEAGKKNACKNRWIKELKKTMKKNKISYKQAMTLASDNRKQKLQPKEEIKAKKMNHELQASHK